jgi:hypothetical protein
MACSAACRAALASGDDSTVAIHWPRAHSRSRVLYMTAGLLLVLVLPCLACLGSPAAGFPCSGDLSRYNRVFEAQVARREAATSRAAARCTRARRGRVGPAARAARDGGGAARAADERARRDKQVRALSFLFVSLLPPPAHRWTSSAPTPEGRTTPRLAPEDGRRRDAAQRRLARYHSTRAACRDSTQLAKAGEASLVRLCAD